VDSLLDIQTSDLPRIEEKLGPRTGTSYLTAVVSRDALPIPINPAHVSPGIDDIARRYTGGECMGWSYFVFNRTTS